VIRIRHLLSYCCVFSALSNAWEYTNIEGPTCKILPQVLIENLKRMDADGAKELEPVVRGQKVVLTAVVTQGPIEEAIALTITAKPDDATASVHTKTGSRPR
jgi:hypothetical protein